MDYAGIDPLQIIGTELAGCRVLRFCGKGAAGHVHEAHNDKDRVAIKLYKEWLFDDNAAVQDERIARESDLRRIAHRNVCRVLDHC